MVMSKTYEFIRKMMYALGANLLSLFVSLLTALLVPRFLGEAIEQYGYLQIYLFYTSYIGFFHFGWCDGIFLRDGGKKYSDLDQSVYSGQFWLLTAIQICIGIVIVFCGVLGRLSEYRFIFIAFAINLIIYIPRTMLAYYLQTTNRIKEYASIATLGRTVYGISILLIISFACKQYEYFVVGDIIGKLFALLLSMWWCRDIVFSRPALLKVVVEEAEKNVSVGCKLMFSNIASMLTTGVVSWGVQQVWNVETYGKVSFSLSVSNLLLTFISAVALVLYPTLRRTEQNSLPKVYTKVRAPLMLSLFGLLLVYYPVRVALVAWLPQYSDSLQYMAILFPMCVYAAKMTLLVQTYMNVFRLEKEMLFVNVVGVLFAVITTIVSVFIMKSLTFAMFSMVASQAFRCAYAEIVLSKHIRICVGRDIFIEILMTVIFIYANWIIGDWYGVCVYAFAYAVYLFLKRKEIRDFILLFKFKGIGI